MVVAYLVHNNSTLAMFLQDRKSKLEIAVYPVGGDNVLISQFSVLIC